MTKQHLQKGLFFLLLMLFPVLVLCTGGEALPSPGDGSDYASSLNGYVGRSLPFQHGLRRINVQLGLLSGHYQQNDIFISGDGLIRNIDAPSPIIVSRNTDVLLQFAQEAGKPTYIMLIPTSCAVLQEQLPPYAQVYNKQRQLIENVYSDLSGKVTVIDVYPTLFNRRSEYLYYRTEDNLTAVGGYYLYDTMSSRMGMEERSLSDYDIEYMVPAYYGDLYQRSPYYGARPDALMAFHDTRSSRKFTVTHRTGGTAKTYHSLFPTHIRETSPGMQSYFGGISPITEFHASSRYSRSLLVFGDRTAMSYLPFVVSNYERVTLVDLFRLPSSDYANIVLDDYDQILFAYSVDTYNSSVPKLAANFLENRDN